jgi:hypothetical protein
VCLLVIYVYKSDYVFIYEFILRAVRPIDSSGKDDCSCGLTTDTGKTTSTSLVYSIVFTVGLNERYRCK